MRSIYLFGIVALAACSRIAAPETGNPESSYAWVEQHFQGGAFGTDDQSLPPDTRALLEEAGIGVKEVIIEELPVCLGTGCPNYSENHYALVRTRDLRRASKLGYLESDGPP